MDISKRIDRLYSELKSSLRTSAQKALNIGQLLSQEKARLPHGEWGAFVSRLPFSERSAQRFMSLWRGREQLKSANLADLALGAALQLVGEPLAVTVDRSTRQETKQLVVQIVPHRPENVAPRTIQIEVVRSPSARLIGTMEAEAAQFRIQLRKQLSGLIRVLEQQVPEGGLDYPSAILAQFETLKPLIARWSRGLRRLEAKAS